MGQHETQAVSIVDDDASLRRSLRNLLTSVGLRVETFASAEDFLRSVQRETTDCLVLDLRMAWMNGLDLLRHLAVTGSRTPVVMLTAHGDEEARRQTLEAGGRPRLLRGGPVALVLPIPSKKWQFVTLAEVSWRSS